MQEICARNIFICTILSTIVNKREQAINLLQKYFHWYDTFYKNKQKGTSKKVAPEIF